MRVQSADRQFRIELDYDSDSQAWFVAETELPGLVLEDADPGRLVSRLVDAAAELHELNRNDCPSSKHLAQIGRVGNGERASSGVGF